MEQTETDRATQRWMEKEDQRERLQGKVIHTGPAKSRRQRRFEAKMRKQGRVEAEDGSWVKP